MRPHNGYQKLDTRARLHRSAENSPMIAFDTATPGRASQPPHPLLPPALQALLPAALHTHCEGARCARGERLFLAGARPEWMFYVVAGEVTLERSGLHGEPVVLQRTRQGFVSEASLRAAVYHCDALAVIDTTVVKLPVRALSTALEGDPAFAGRWIAMLNAEVRRLRLHCERLSMKSITERVCHLIQTEGQGGVYVAATGIKSLAGELGVTHEALYRQLAAMARARVIAREGGTLRLLQR